MIRVALTGGIGAGKSEVERLLSARGMAVVDADQLAREALAPGTPGLTAVVASFGSGVLAGDGSLNRNELARWVFSDEPSRQQLEAIVHPLVRSRLEQAAEEAAAAGHEIIVMSVPLLVETAAQSGYDLIVVVDAPDDVRLHRLVALRGLAENDAQARMAAQSSRVERLAAADMVIHNTGTLEDLDREVDRVSAQIRAWVPGQRQKS